VSSSGIDRLMPVVSGSGTVLVAGLHTPGMYGSKKSAGNVTLLRVSRLALFPTFLHVGWSQKIKHIFPQHFSVTSFCM